MTSSDYIQLYDGDAALLTESLEQVQKAASIILAALGNGQGGEPPG